MGAESATCSIQSDEAKWRQSVGYLHQVLTEASSRRLEEVVGLRARLTHEMLAAVQDSEDSNEKLHMNHFKNTIPKEKDANLDLLRAAVAEACQHRIFAVCECIHD